MSLGYPYLKDYTPKDEERVMRMLRKRFPNRVFPTSVVPDMVKRFDELTWKLSMRAFNCLKVYDLVDAEDFVSEGLFMPDRDYLKLRNMGKKSLMEVQAIKQGMLDFFNNYPDAPEEERGAAGLPPIASITTYDEYIRYLEPQRDKVEAFFQKCLEEGPVRLQKPLMRVGFDCFMENFLFESNARLLKLRNIGKKSLIDAEYLKADMRRYLDELLYAAYAKEANAEEELACLSENLYEISGDVAEWTGLFFKDHGYYPMLQVFCRGGWGTDVEKDVVFMLEGVNRTKLSREEIAQMFGLTPERIRQIWTKGWKRIESSVFSRDDNCRDMVQAYLNGDGLVSGEHVALLRMQEEQEVEMEPQFLLRLLALMSGGGYTLFQRRQRQGWRKKGQGEPILVASVIQQAIDFDSWLLEFAKMLAENEEECAVSLQELIAQSEHCHTVDEAMITRIQPVAQWLVEQHFGLQADVLGNIILPQMRKPKKLDVSPVLYEILRDNGNPMHLRDIFAEFKRLHPEHPYTQPEQLRSHLQHHDGIVAIGRKSTYGLKEWKHVFLGSMSEAIRKYLKQKTVPVNIEMVHQYVVKKIPTATYKSIEDLLCVGRGKDYVALQKKQPDEDQRVYYIWRGRTCPMDFEPYVAQQDGAERLFPIRFRMFKTFVELNGRYPQMGIDPQEDKLCRWRLMARGTRYDITPEQREELMKFDQEHLEMLEKKHHQPLPAKKPKLSADDISGLIDDMF